MRELISSDQKIKIKNKKQNKTVCKSGRKHKCMPGHRIKFSSKCKKI